MSVGFFVATSRSYLSRERIHAAFVARTFWENDGTEKAIDFHGHNWCVVCLKDRCSAQSNLWREESDGRRDLPPSFVHVLGWCYRISGTSEHLCDNDYREMINRFRVDKPPLSEDFGGQFVAVIYDSARQRLAVQPDRLAQGACFFGEADGEFAASNRALRLASYFGSALDGQSVLAQMRGTHVPFGRTLFTGVRRLMGARYLEFDLADGRAQIKKPYSLFVPARDISYAGAVDVVTDTVKGTVRRLLEAGPVRFDLTGGNDTRVIAAAVENITRCNGSHGFGFRVADPEYSPDVRVARRVADISGWPLIRVDREISTEASLEELARAATTGDGNFPLHHIWERAASERSYAAQNDQREWKTHVGATAGELFRGYFYTQEMLSLGRSNVNYARLLAYRTYASRGVNLRILGTNPPTFDAHDEALLAPYRAIGDEGGSLPNANKLDVMYLQRHCYRAGNTLSWVSNFLNVRLPFLSWELAGLGLSLPWKYRANRGLMQRVLCRLSPKLASIPNEDGEPMKPLSLATLPAFIISKIPTAIAGARRVAWRALGRPGGTAILGLPIPQPAYFSILDQARSISNIVDPALIRQIRAEAASQQSSADSVTTFYVLCTIELLLRHTPALQHRLVFD